MTTQTQQKKNSPRVRTSAQELASQITESLARKLIDQAASCCAAIERDDGEDDGQEVILDLEVDGMRCLLIRLRQQESMAAVPITLSPRELEIARMIAKGYPNKTIAAVLEISAWTVCTHIRRIFAKLGVGSRAAMVAKLAEDRAIGEKII
jgi:DNA-binding CsgD family transcriptional regulator